MTREELIQQIESYTPYNEQEEHDKELILSALKEREENFTSFWQPRIVQITEKYLVKGQKVSNCSREQTEALDLIVSELKDLVAGISAE